MNNTKTEILSLLEQASGSILIACHIDPDGDTMGSAVALGLWLRARGKAVTLYCRHEVPKLYAWAFGGLFTQTLPQQIAMLVCVDCAAENRLGEAQALIATAPCSVGIDHHYTNTCYLQHQWIDSEASSTAEMLCDMFTSAGIALSVDMAQALYIGMVTDSGQFSFDSVRPHTLRMAAVAQEAGANVAEINHRIFRTRSRARTLLLGESLRTLTFYNHGKVALLYMNKDMEARCGAGYADGESIINYAIEVEGVEIAVMLKQQFAAYKLSIRTSARYDAAKLAERMGGGGHARAAGCSLSPDYDTALATLQKALQAELGETLERDL